MQGQKRNKGRQGSRHEGKGRRQEESHDRYLPEMRHQDVQNPGQSLTSGNEIEDPLFQKNQKIASRAIFWLRNSDNVIM